MGFFSRLFGRTSTKAVTAIETLFGGIPIHRFKDYESYLKAGTNKVWASWKACDIVSQEVSTTPVSIVRKGSTDPVEAPGIIQIMEFPNHMQTFSELVYLTVMHLKFTGNAYWYKSEATHNGDRPKELYALNPKRVSIVPDRNLGVQGYIHRINGDDIPFDPSEIIHFKRPHPNNDFYGMGDIEAGEAVFNEHINRSTWEQGFWKNGASPSGVLICEDQIKDQDKWDKAKAKFNDQYGGVKNSGKTAWLTGKWRYQQLGLNSKDMQSLESSKLNIEQIFAQHGVPLSVAGIREAANFATSRIDNQRFKEYTVLPMVKLIEDSMNTDLVSGFGPRLQVRFNVAGLINVHQAMEDFGPLFDRGGMSINELREAAGLPRDDENPSWNQHYINAGYVPLDLSGILDEGRTQREAERTVQRFLDSATVTVKPEVNGAHR